MFGKSGVNCVFYHVFTGTITVALKTTFAVEYLRNIRGQRVEMCRRGDGSKQNRNREEIQPTKMGGCEIRLECTFKEGL